MVARKDYTGEQFRYNGVDRIDNSRGYEEGNVVPCCRQCNWSKRDLTTEQFLAWVLRVNKHLLHEIELNQMADSLFSRAHNGND